jgi:hypothetical protein
MLTIQELDRMSQIDIEQISKDSLVDIRDVNIDTSLPIAERMENYLDQIQNPYCFRCGDVKVRVRFEQNGPDLRSRFVSHLMNQKTA